MTDLAQRLEDAKATVARLEHEAAGATCEQLGRHDWQSIGGKNAGCHDLCICSVPVNVCSRCKDCDYGDNDDARQTRQDCADRYGDPAERYAEPKL